MDRDKEHKAQVINRYLRMFKRFPPKDVAKRDLGVFRNMAITRWKHRQRGVEGTLTLEEWHAMIQDHHGRCHWCRKKAKGGLTMDHVTPKAFGGGFTRENIVPACEFCNNLRGTATIAIIEALGLQDKDKRQELLDQGG